MTILYSKIKTHNNDFSLSLSFSIPLFFIKRRQRSDRQFEFSFASLQTPPRWTGEYRRTNQTAPWSLHTSKQRPYLA